MFVREGLTQTSFADVAAVFLGEVPTNYPMASIEKGLSLLRAYEAAYLGGGIVEPGLHPVL
jgi:hypothetical protein